MEILAQVLGGILIVAYIAFLYANESYIWEISFLLIWISLGTLIMASVDDPVEYSKANDVGWRTFRTKLESDPLLPNEIICPYPKAQCVDYGMCDGKDSRFRKNIAVNAHGVRYKVSRYKEYRTQLELPVV